MSVRNPSKPELHSYVPPQEASFIMTIFSLDASLWPLHLRAGLSQSLGAEHVWHLENPNLIGLNETINWSSWSNTPSLRFFLPKDIGKLTKKLHKTEGNRRLLCWRRIRATSVEVFSPHRSVLVMMPCVLWKCRLQVTALRWAHAVRASG